MQHYQFKEWIQNTLNELNIKIPTPIQKKVIYSAMKFKNMIGIAPTGTGKTFAFLLPILNNLDFQQNYQAIIIVPTRELANQIYNQINFFKKQQPKLIAQLWVGGIDLKKQINKVNNTAQIIIATPDRFLQIYNESKNVNLKNLKTIVLDEADMLLDLGNFKAVDQIFEKIKNNENLQKLAFSATIHELLSKQLAKYFQDTKIVNVANSIYDNEKIKHFIVHNDDKLHAIATIANQINPYMCLIFANTAKQVDEIFQMLKNQNRKVINLHGDLASRQRKNNFKDIKNLKYQYVVASDLASRGLDIDGASHVISYNMPNDIEWYVHRAGRCGRQKYEGISYVLYSENDRDKILKLQAKGVEFKNLKIRDNRLVSSKKRIVKKQIKISEAQKQEIKSILIKSKQKVKPNYKKKQKLALQKINKKYKKAHIDKTMKQKLRLTKG